MTDDKKQDEMTIGDALASGKDVVRSIGDIKVSSLKTLFRAIWRLFVFCGGLWCFVVFFAVLYELIDSWRWAHDNPEYYAGAVACAIGVKLCVVEWRSAGVTRWVFAKLTGK